VFNSWSGDLGGFTEKIAPGAFKESLSRGDDVRALLNHDANYVLGRTKSGTLELSEDKKGLRIVNAPPDTQWARDLQVSIDRGDIDQMSFGFVTRKDQWEEDKETKKVSRTLLEVDLVDVSPVTFPAYPDTTVAIRSMDEWKTTLEQETIQTEDPTVNSGPVTPGDPTIKLASRKRRIEFKEKLLAITRR
jgi:HK97 family phage prohead protease